MSVQAADKSDAGVRHDEKKERADKIDFKMVTFSLAGKEYGIDIMNVKEIASAGRFTYVPNAAPFVRGVYNLRGDIISIIDLRIMFHLPAERKDDDALESLLILRIEDHAFGVIVDNIDKVVGVSRAGIQPPHPIFGDINVKYIKGIIENQGKLYIILNVEKLFAPKSEEAPAEALAPAARMAAAPAPARPREQGAASASADVNADFVKETLFAFKRFGVSSVNEEWFKVRYGQWSSSRKATDIQLKEQPEADQFLETFYSPCTGELWSEAYADAVVAAMPRFESKSINVWNPGCGKGYETYSLAVALRRSYPEARIKIWANDSDLLAISMAPNMVFTPENVPEVYRGMMVKGRNGFTFEQSIRDSIFFEFHDVMNSNPVPPVDIILCRDTVSFLSAADQNKLLSDFCEKAKHGGAVVLGSNERMPMDGWNRSGESPVSVYVKEA
ncbi:MAG: chemotaxis protein CheW [Spirochaetae bacterium HGW-Spirochaetae-3]|jgi:purine-binding chemotaxis protein CheW|nr:MAG: chemotaxis protein CheW [Spirochaetae bacterium HGW-Spirochaetae-3]